MPEHPESFPVNALVPIEGTPLENNDVGLLLKQFFLVDTSVYPTSARVIPYITSYHCNGSDSHAWHYNPACCGASNIG